jgi:hypothetical protein
VLSNAITLLFMGEHDAKAKLLGLANMAAGMLQVAAAPWWYATAAIVPLHFGAAAMCYAQQAGDSAGLFFSPVHFQKKQRRRK